MRLEGFGYVGALGFADPERTARMLVNELGEVIDAIVDAPESFGPIVLPFALLPAMCGDQGRVAVCGKFGGNATLFPLLNYHFEESF